MNLTDQQSEILLEAYKKHATELLAIEESQQKLTALFLTIFGVGGSVIAALKNPLTCATQWGLTMIVVTALAIGFLYTYKRGNARITVRMLLTRCEEAMGFYEAGAYLAGEKLYKDKYFDYSKKGAWLNYLMYFLVPAVAAGFLIVVWASGQAAT